MQRKITLTVGIINGSVCLLFFFPFSLRLSTVALLRFYSVVARAIIFATWRSWPADSDDEREDARERARTTGTSKAEGVELEWNFVLLKPYEVIATRVRVKLTLFNARASDLPQADRTVHDISYGAAVTRCNARIC